MKKILWMLMMLCCSINGYASMDSVGPIRGLCELDYNKKKQYYFCKKYAVKTIYLNVSVSDFYYRNNKKFRDDLYGELFESLKKINEQVEEYNFVIVDGSKLDSFFYKKDKLYLSFYVSNPDMDGSRVDAIFSISNMNFSFFVNYHRDFGSGNYEEALKKIINQSASFLNYYIYDVPSWKENK